MKPFGASGVGYHCTIASRSDAAFSDPLVQAHGYTEPLLTPPQSFAVVIGASAVTACVRHPITRVKSFSFLADVPGEASRVYASDKRAHFFRTLLGVRWFSGPSVLWGTAEYTFLLCAFAALRDALPGANGPRGFAAGAFTGAAYAALRHPYDVLRATAEAVPRFSTGNGNGNSGGAGAVLRAALRERPAVLYGLRRGFALAAAGRAAQFGAQFGVYNATRYDGVGRGPLSLFLYCHAGAFLGLLLQYPLLAVKQQLHVRNCTTRGKAHSYRSLIAEMRGQHGITKVFDGFFSTRPLLNAVPAALLMTLYDMWTRQYTEYLHPERRQVHATTDQWLCSTRTSPYAATLSAYEFAQK